MIKPQNARGTRDFDGSDLQKRHYLFNTLSGIFKKYGFSPLETPALENLSTLTGKYGEEGEQLLFRILNSGDFTSGLAKDDWESGEMHRLRSKISDRGLRYDLTIPFARFVAANHHRLPIPYKRYQMQPVWRADRPAKGRYREFYQCDVDVVGSQSMLSDAELLYIVDEVFAALNMPKATIKLNNRKLLFGIAETMGFADRFIPFTVAIDKLDKVGVDGVRKELQQRGFSDNEAQSVLELISLDGDNTALMQTLRERLKDNSTALKGLDELSAVLEYMEHVPLGHCQCQLDFTLARGLNYYTSTIFEVVLEEVDMGSVASGGRYDALTASFGLKDMPGVGLSFGAERIFDVMNNLGLFPNLTASHTKALITNFGESEEPHAFRLLQSLRQAGVAAELFPTSAKLKKQFRYADQKGVPLVVLLGTQEIEAQRAMVKHMESGTEESVSMEELAAYIDKTV